MRIPLFHYSKVKSTEILQLSRTGMPNRLRITSNSVRFSRQILGQHFVPPATYAHHIEAFSGEDDLFYGFLAIVTSTLEIIPYFHPAHFTFRISDY